MTTIRLWRTRKKQVRVGARAREDDSNRGGRKEEDHREAATILDLGALRVLPRLGPLEQSRRMARRALLI